MKNAKTLGRTSQRGTSLVEAMSVLVVTGIAVGASAPSFEALRQRAELANVAGQLETDLHYTRSEAVARNRTLRWSLLEAAGGSCYLIHTGAASTCTCGDEGSASCGETGVVLRSVWLPAGGRVQMHANARTLTFDPLKGTVTPTATIRAESRDGHALHQVISLLGRVRTCSPKVGTPGVSAC